VAIRTFRKNFRTRSGLSPDLWNSFWTDLSLDLQDFIDPVRSYYIGVSGFVSSYEIVLSGIAGKEQQL
jgi:hypothetical protein